MTQPPPASRLRRLLRFVRRAVLILFALVVVGIVGLILWLERDPEPYMIERHGELVDVHEELTASDGRFITTMRNLYSSTGLTVRVRTRRPYGLDEVRHPVVVFVCGGGVGCNALDFVPESNGVVLAAIDIPFEGDIETLRGWDVVRAIPRARRALHDTPPALMLVVDCLSAKSWVDPSRIELVGVSLGAQLACVTGAIDERFARVWAVHGGGQIDRLATRYLARHVDYPLLRPVVGRIPRLLLGGARPEEYAPRIAPRPFIMVNAKDDELVTPDLVDALYESARDPKELIWVEGVHVSLRHLETIEPLVKVILSRVAD